MSKLKVGDNFLKISGQYVHVPYVFFDNFNRGDGLIGNNWIDLKTDFPDGNDSSLVVNGTWGHDPQNNPNQHFTIYRQTGLSDNISVKVKWRNTFEQNYPPDWPDGRIGTQTGPLVLFDPEAPDVDKLGLTFLQDFTVAMAFYLTNATSSLIPPESVEIYDINAHPTLTYNDLTSNADRVLEIRVVGGKMAAYIDDVRIVGPVDVPAEYVGNTFAGLQAVAGQPYAPSEFADWVEIKRYDTSLGDYPDPPTVDDVGVTNKSSSSTEIEVAYPADVTIGKLLIAYVCTSGSGTLTAPDGWTAFGSAKLTAAFGVQAFYKQAVGDETGTATFTRSGTANNGGVMITVSGHNPMLSNMQTFIDGSNSATVNMSNVTATQTATTNTSITSPTFPITGNNRLYLWCGGMAANETITDPSEYTNITSLGTSGAAVNFSLCYKVITTAITEPHQTPNGSRQNNGASVALGIRLFPDPRE